MDVVLLSLVDPIQRHEFILVLKRLSHLELPADVANGDQALTGRLLQYPLFVALVPADQSPISQFPQRARHAFLHSSKPVLHLLLGNQFNRVHQPH